MGLIFILAAGTSAMAAKRKNVLILLCISEESMVTLYPSSLVSAGIGSAKVSQAVLKRSGASFDNSLISGWRFDARAKEVMLVRPLGA